MGQGPSVARRALLGGAATLLLGGCGRKLEQVAQARWIGAAHARGHRLRPGAATLDLRHGIVRKADVLVVGAGVAGLAAARALARRGVDAVHILELEDAPGGNSRAHAIGGQRCPLGAHYLPVPGPQAVEVSQWLHELGLLRSQSGRTVADERHLCHSPQERLFIDGSWHDALLPPAPAGSATLAQYRRFESVVETAQRELGFALPTHRARWTPAHQRLDHISFAAWLDDAGLDDARLRWYLDYACRDDYGAGSAAVSAWAGLHYFASRHGFHAPGGDALEHDAVFTWPEGNAWLVERLAAPWAAARLHLGRTVLRVDASRTPVQVLCWDEAEARAEAWSARAVVMAVPLFAAARMLEPAPPALAAAVAAQLHAPWLVANVALSAALLDRSQGAPSSWDNVRYGSASLGYVDARHQSLDPSRSRTVLTAYWALPAADRARLLDDAATTAWSRQVVDELAAVHPDLPGKIERIDLMRYGHGMSVPAPGVRSHPALAALARMTGPVVFAHADLAGYSVFEEAFTHGCRAGDSLVL
jgi:monoamine oxidase